MDSVECLVIGAGVVGLSVARALARARRDVVVVEAKEAIGTGVSSRNSEVIHAGIYYPTGLAKTRLCVEGKAMLYRFCREYGVPHRRSGKLIVAADESEIAKLGALEAQAKANGVDDLLCLSGAEARALEPALRANRALLSPSTGIVDSHSLMLALKGDAEAHGAMIALSTPVVSGRAHSDGVTIETGGAEPTRFTATLVVNAAGLHAQAVARAIDGLPADKIPPLFLAKATTFLSPFARRFPGSSIRCRRQAALASILHWTSPGRRDLDRTSNGWRRSTTTSIRGVLHPSTPGSEPIGPICRTVPCSPATPESAQRLFVLEGWRPIFLSRRNATTASEGSSICSA
jgi:glycine/D-amino acid oxidase-like deaminating enzyme